MEELVSIITPSFNCGKYIGETIKSVIMQSYQNWEMIIVDDCSSDDTRQIISEYNDNRIKLLINSHNRGAAYCRNKAIKEAKGKYIAFLDADDVWLPEKLKKQINFMRDNGYSFTCAYCDYIDENSMPLEVIDTSPNKVGKVGMYLYNWIACLTVIYYVPVVGMIQIEEIPKRNDYALWLKVIKKTECYCYPEILGSYRVRKNSISHTSKIKLVKEHYNLFRKCEKMSFLKAILLTFINVLMYVYRRFRYVKKI